MWLRLLVALTLLLPILALAAEGTSLRRYRGTPARELLALCFCIVIYIAVWFAADRSLEAVTGSSAAGIVAASALALLAVPLLVFFAYKLFGVKASAATPSH